MAEDGFGPRYYQKQAAQMRGLADREPAEAMRSIYTRLADKLLKLAEKKAERGDGDEDPSSP